MNAFDLISDETYGFSSVAETIHFEVKYQKLVRKSSFFQKSLNQKTKIRRAAEDIWQLQLLCQPFRQEWQKTSGFWHVLGDKLGSSYHIE